MARTHTFSSKAKLVETLKGINTVSRFLGLQLVEMGFAKVEVIHKAGRGRPEHVYTLTGKARGYLALAANWGKRNSNLKQYKSNGIVILADYRLAA